MRNTDLSVIIKLSAQRSWRSLFRPFVLKKWFFLMFIAFLSGNLGGGGCGNGGGDWGRTQKKAEASPSRVIQPIPTQEDLSNPKPLISAPDNAAETNPSPAAAPSTAPARIVAQPSGHSFPDWRHWPRWIYGMIGVGGLFILVLMVLLSWLSSRFQFLWFNAIVNDDASIVKPFGEYQKEGDSLFKLYLAVMAASLLFWAALGGWVFWSMKAHGLFQQAHKPGFMDYFVTFAPPVLVFLLVCIVAAVLMHVVNSFIVTIMAMDRCPFREGWRKFCELYGTNAGEIWVYLLTRFGLGLVAAVLLPITAIFVMLVMGLGGAMIAGILYLIFGVLLKWKVIFYIFMFLLGVPFLAALLLVLIMIELPIAVFFRNFSLYYLSSLDCAYRPLALTETSPGGG